MEELKDILLKIARDSINEKLTNQTIIDKEKLLKEYPSLAEERAVFVTITEDENLRGCIGSIVPRRSLLEDLIENAKSAAFSDPRFNSLSSEEFDKIKLEVSILTIPTEVEYDGLKDLEKKIKPSIDGVIIDLHGRRGTFLPQVWEQLPDFETFFAHLYLKAGIDMDYLSKTEEQPAVFIYQVEKFKEE